MGNKNHIKILTPASEVKVNESNHLITLKSGGSVLLEFTNTEGYTDEEIKNIRWICNMFHGRPQNSHLHKTLKGAKANFIIPSVYSGGGLGWVEPILTGETPTYTISNGYFINAIGKRSIDKVEWRDTHGALISGSKFFKEGVQLHVYTTGMYGHEIKVWLKDVNNVDFDLDLDKDVNNSNNSLEQYFNREVKVLQNADDKTSKVQKVIINIRLEDRWDYAGKTLNIIPIVGTNFKNVNKKEFSNNKLVVKKPTKKEENKVNPATKTGNKPTIVGDIVTDVADFKPCFYSQIKAVVTRNTKIKQDVVIYEQGKSPDQNIFSFPIVAGIEYSKAQIKFTLDTNTERCLLNEVHTDRVIDLSKIEEAVVVESRTPAKKTRIADSAEVLDDLFHKKGQVKGRDHEYKGNHVKAGARVNGPIEMKVNSSIPFEKTITVYKKEAGSDTEVEIDLAYDFTEDGKGLLKNIWPTKKSRAITYPIFFNSCRKQHQINIEVYPDIKWILQIGFNYDQEKFNKIRTDEHKKYETKIQELEKAYEKETVSHRQRENDFKEFKKRAQKRLNKAEKKVQKNESIHKLDALNEARNKAKSDLEHWEKKLNNHKAKKSIVDKNDQLDSDKDQAKQDKKDNIKTDHKNNLKNPGKALKDGLANVTVSLAAEWDRPYKGVELTPHYKKAKEFVNFIISMEAHARKLVKGKDNKSQSNKEDPDKLKKLEEALKGRPLFTFEIIPPSLGIALSWCAEHPEKVLEPSMGVVWEGEIKAEPLIGFDFNFDVIALVAKAHPIAKGIVTVMDLLSSLADKAEIRLDFKVQGKINLAGKGRVNTANGVTNFNREELSKNDDKSPFVLSGELDFSLVSQIQLINKYESWFWGDVETKFDAGAKLITGILAEGKVGADQNGMYLEPKILFKGIKLVFHLSVSAEARADEDTDPYYEIAPIEDEVPLVLMNAYEWGAAELGMSKWYLT